MQWTILMGNSPRKYFWTCLNSDLKKCTDCISPKMWKIWNFRKIGISLQFWPQLDSIWLEFVNFFWSLFDRYSRRLLSFKVLTLVVLVKSASEKGYNVLMWSNTYDFWKHDPVNFKLNTASIFLRVILMQNDGE